jgi:uncharacterized protein (DUF2147 family)
MITSRRTFIFASAAAIAAIAPLIAFAAPASISGRWVTQDKGAIIDIGPCGAKLCGVVSKFLKAVPDGLDQRDVRNPNKALRARKLMGLAILSGFIAKDDEWHGSIYDPESGKTYRSVVYRVKSGGLVVKGCIGPFCQSQKWTAAK